LIDTFAIEPAGLNEAATWKLTRHARLPRITEGNKAIASFD
jgi:hypothetical protein